MNILESKSELVSLFTLPFNPSKIIYSLNSDFFRDANLACKSREKQLAIKVDEEDLLHNPLPEFPCGEHGCRAMFTTVYDYEVHYRISHSIECTECKKSFPSYSLLDLHIQERHDTYLDTAKDKNLLVYNCVVDSCDTMFSSLEERNEHAIKTHNYPAKFKFKSVKGMKNLERMDTTSCVDVPVPINVTRSTRKSPPRNICFGRGSSRTFIRKQKLKSASTDISMKELADAL